MNIEIRSPTRVDLAGGTLDCWPLYNFVGPCFTVNLSINISTGVKLNIRQDQTININIRDLNFSKKYLSFKEIYHSKDPEVGLILETLKIWNLNGVGFDLETYSESPVGGGLGGSSSLVISLLKAFGIYFKKEWELHEIVTVAHNLESAFLRTLTGTQDYIPAFQHGLNIVKYSPYGFEVKKVDFDLNYISDHILLVYTGRSHHSGINNWQVIQSVVEKDSRTLTALSKMAAVAKDMTDVCLNGDWQKIPELFKREFSARLELSEGFSSPEILALENIALQNGAHAVKICGAGGGGCVMIWCAPKKRDHLQKTIMAEGYQVLDARPVKD